MLSLYLGSAWAAPATLVTHNHTDVESNAYIDGTIPSLYPTKAHGESKVIWNAVRLACHGHTKENQCMALIKMSPNTPESVDIGFVTLNLLSGEITPKELVANGYRVIVNGPGETTLEKL
jgi:hypothetical protein